MFNVTDKMVEAGAKALAEEQEKAAWENFNDVQKDRYRDEVRIVLAAALAAQWQGIESAPKDTPILAFNALTGWYNTKWDGENFPCGFWGRPGTWFPRPTHWQPHPAPPAQQDLI